MSNRSKLVISWLLLIAALNAAQGLLGNVTASLLQQRLGNYARVIPYFYAIITAILLGALLFERKRFLPEYGHEPESGTAREPLSPRRRFQAVLGGLRELQDVARVVAQVLIRPQTTIRLFSTFSLAKAVMVSLIAMLMTSVEYCLLFRENEPFSEIAHISAALFIKAAALSLTVWTAWWVVRRKQKLRQVFVVCLLVASAPELLAVTAGAFCEVLLVRCDPPLAFLDRPIILSVIKSILGQIDCWGDPDLNKCMAALPARVWLGADVPASIAVAIMAGTILFLLIYQVRALFAFRTLVSGGALRSVIAALLCSVAFYALVWLTISVIEFQNDNPCDVAIPSAPALNPFQVSYRWGVACRDRPLIDAWRPGEQPQLSRSQEDHDAGVTARVLEVIRVMVAVENGAMEEGAEGNAARDVKVTVRVDSSDPKEHRVSARVTALNAPPISSSEWWHGGDLLIHTDEPTRIEYSARTMRACFDFDEARARTGLYGETCGGEGTAKPNIAIPVDLGKAKTLPGETEVGVTFGDVKPGHPVYLLFSLRALKR
jgi:hypothetical protein